MRETLAMMVAAALICALIFAGSVPEALPPGRQTALLGLMFPGLFAEQNGGDQVIFTWPLLRRMVQFFTQNG